MSCGYCREEDHTSQECLTRKNDKRQERINYRKLQKMQIKTVWQERANYAEKLNYNKSNEETTTNMSSLSETIKICDNLKSEVEELLVENQKNGKKMLK